MIENKMVMVFFTFGIGTYQKNKIFFGRCDIE